MPVDPADSDTRLVFGRYRLHEVLGAGGMGTVWRATDEVLGRVVALKQLRQTRQLSPEEAALARQRTMREARVAAALHHPNVVSIFDVLTEDDETWLVLEYVPSASLGVLLRERGTLTPAEAATIGAPIAAALACAHTAGIVHRDVKPDNVLVTDTTAKLTDFGIARDTTSPTLTATGLLTGTPAYLAPETARGEGTDTRTDMYALGATLYTMVEGAPPFGTSGDMLALIMRISRGGAPEARNAGPLTALIARLLSDDPTARPTAVQAHQALTRLATTAHGPPMYTSSTLVPQPWGFPAQPGPAASRRRRRLRIIATSVLAVLAIGSAATIAIVNGVLDRPIHIDDVRTADPCSLLDTAALSRFGTVAMDPENAGFNGCRANITLPNDNVLSVFTVLRGLLAPTDELGGTPEQIGTLTLTRFPASTFRCRRQLLLPDRNLINVNVERYDATVADLCAIADTAAVAATTKLTDQGISTRTPPDTGSPLAGIKACDLLTPAELVAVPGLPATGKPGPADWSCNWKRSSGDEVEIYYFRALPPSQTPSSTGIDIGGREADTRTGDGVCTVEFAEHYYTGQDGTRRAHNVLISVYGSAPEAQLCTPAATLAKYVAARLPPTS